MTGLSTQSKPRQDRGPITEADLRLSFFPRYALQDWRLDRPTLRVLIALSCFTDGATGEVRPAQETIAAIAGVRRPRVNEIIADLVELGYLVQHERSRVWTYLVMNPDIPKAGSVPPGGTYSAKRKAKKSLARGGHDPVPPGGTPPVPPGGTQTSLSSLNTGEAARAEEERSSPIGSEVEDDIGSASPQTSGSASGPARGQDTKSFTPKPKRSPSHPPYNALGEASKHMSRQDAGGLIGRAMKVGNEQALKEFGFDYRGKPLQVDLEEAIANTPGKATQTEEVKS